MGLPGCLSGKESACNAGNEKDANLTLGLGRSPGGANGNPLLYPCLKNPLKEPGGLQSTGAQRVGHNRVTEYSPQRH